MVPAPGTKRKADSSTPVITPKRQRTNKRFARADDGKDTLSVRIEDVSKFVSSDYITSLNAPRSVATSVCGISWQVYLLKAFHGGKDKLICRLTGTQRVSWRCTVDVRIRLGCEETFVRSETGLHMESGARRDVPLISLKDLLNTELGYTRDNRTSVSVELIVRDVVYNFAQISTLPADTMLSVGGYSFHVHKGYLSVVSPYFAALLKEGSPDQSDSEGIPLAKIDGRDFLKFLLVVYPTRQPVQDSNVGALLRLSEHFDATPLVDECISHLTKHSRLSFKDKLLIAESEPTHLPYLRAHLLKAAKPEEIEQLAEADELSALSKETMSRVLRKYVSQKKASRT